MKALIKINKSLFYGKYIIKCISKKQLKKLLYELSKDGFQWGDGLDFADMNEYNRIIEETKTNNKINIYIDPVYGTYDINDLYYKKQGYVIINFKSIIFSEEKQND